MRRPQLTYANAMSTIAVFIALGGTSYAVAKLPAGSVGSRELRKGAVTTQKLAKGAVTSDAVKDGSITAADLTAGAAAGPRGPRGAEGKDGRDGVGGGETILGATVANGEFVTFPTPAESWAPLATVTVPAGAWNIDAQTRLQWGPKPAIRSVWSNCDLNNPAGDVLTRGSAYVGNDAEGAITQIVPLTTAITVSSPTKLTFGCRHQNDIEAGLGAVQTSLRATRVVRVEQQ